MTTRVIPSSAAQAATPANGRNYLSAAGAQDVPDQDAAILRENNWLAIGPSGPTSARPTVWPPNSGTRLTGPGLTYVDTTLGKVIVYNGAAWIDPISGSAV